MQIRRSELARAHPGLVWSNPEASDETIIRAALLRPRFRQLLDIAHAVGIESVEQQWALLVEEGSPDAKRARSSVERILRHIREGAEIAAAGD